MINILLLLNANAICDENIPSLLAHTESVCQKTGTDCIPKSEVKNNSRPKMNNLRPIS